MSPAAQSHGFYKTRGHALVLAPSTLGPLAGNGVFVRGRVAAGQLLTFYGGVFYELFHFHAEAASPVWHEEGLAPPPPALDETWLSPYTHLEPGTVLYRWVRDRRCFADGNQYLLNGGAEFYLADGSPRGLSRQLAHAWADRARAFGTACDLSWLAHDTPDPVYPWPSPLGMGGYINHQPKAAANVRWDVLQVPASVGPCPAPECVPCLDVTRAKLHEPLTVATGGSVSSRPMNSSWPSDRLMCVIAARDLCDEELFVVRHAVGSAASATRFCLVLTRTTLIHCCAQDYKTDPLSLGSGH